MNSFSVSLIVMIFFWSFLAFVRFSWLFRHFCHVQGRAQLSPVYTVDPNLDLCIFWGSFVDTYIGEMDFVSAHGERQSRNYGLYDPRLGHTSKAEKGLALQTAPPPQDLLVPERNATRNGATLCNVFIVKIHTAMVISAVHLQPIH